MLSIQPSIPQLSCPRIVPYKPTNDRLFSTFQMHDLKSYGLTKKAINSLKELIALLFMRSLLFKSCLTVSEPHLVVFS